MPANEALRFKKPGEDLTGKATAAVTGKRFLGISANRTGGGAGGLSTDLANVYSVAHATAAGVVIGVSAHDAASGSLVGVLSGGIVPVTAGATITAGQRIEVGTNGQAIPLAAGIAVGVAMTGAASGADAEIKLFV